MHTRLYSLPPNLEHFAEAIERPMAILAGMSVADFAAGMPPTTHDYTNGISYVQKTPRDYYDPAKALVLMASYGNPDGVNWHIRSEATRLIHKALTGENLQTIIFPQPNLRHPYGTPGRHTVRPYFNLSKDDFTKMRGGDFAPIGKRVLDVVNAQGISQVHIAGYSGGSSLAGAVMSQAARRGQAMTIGNSGLYEPPTLNKAVKRNQEISSDYLKSAGGFFGGVAATGIDAFSRVQQARIPADLPGQVLGSAYNWLSGYLLDQQRVLKSGFGETTFGADMWDFTMRNTETKVTVARGEYSTITSREALDELRLHCGESILTEEWKDCDHGSGNNLPAFAVMVSCAIRGVLPESVVL